jgi:hypothetical protein
MMLQGLGITYYTEPSTEPFQGMTQAPTMWPMPLPQPTIKPTAITWWTQKPDPVSPGVVSVPSGGGLPAQIPGTGPAGTPLTPAQWAAWLANPLVETGGGGFQPAAPSFVDDEPHAALALMPRLSPAGPDGLRMTPAQWAAWLAKPLVETPDVVRMPVGVEAPGVGAEIPGSLPGEPAGIPGTGPFAFLSEPAFGSFPWWMVLAAAGGFFLMRGRR